jgi:hypothetical protein
MNLPTWTSFENLLYGLSHQPGYKPKRGEWKKGSPLITPSIFREGTTRANANVISWAGWAALDIDSFEGTMDDVLKGFENIQYACYSSASSTVEKPKFRMVFPLTRHVEQEKIRHLWYALNREFNSLGDPQTKDLSRMYYVPAVYPGAHQFFMKHNGTTLDPDELMAKHDFSSPHTLGGNSLLSQMSPEMAKKIMEYRQAQLQNRNFSWSGYADCPFVSKKAVSNFKQIAGIDGSGRYAKMYGIMVSIASQAMKRGYPITSSEIATLCREIDQECGGRYKDRPFEIEAERAIVYSCQSV